MRNATRDLLRVSLTVGAITAVLLAAEFSAPRPGPVRSVAIARADSIVHVRSISVARGAAPAANQPAPDLTLTKPSPKQRTQVAQAS